MGNERELLKGGGEGVAGYEETYFERNIILLL